MYEFDGNRSGTGGFRNGVWKFDDDALDGFVDRRQRHAAGTVLVQTTYQSVTGADQITLGQ